MKRFVQVAIAIDYIHQKKVLHRDLKTQNIFLTESGMVKLGDFGIAKVLDQTLDMAQTAIGTPLYMAPEVCTNKPYNFKSDVWALGCVLYEAITLKHPFDARDLRTLFLKIMRGVYNPVPYRFSNKMRALVKKLLNTSPKLRPSVRDILQTKYVSKYIVKFVIPQMQQLQ